MVEVKDKTQEKFKTKPPAEDIQNKPKISDTPNLTIQDFFPSNMNDNFLEGFTEVMLERSKNFNQLMGLGQKFTSELFFSGLLSTGTPILDPMNSVQTWMNSFTHFMRNPDKVFTAQMDLWQKYTQLCSYSFEKLSGEDATPVISPARGDRRFRGEAWNETFFDFLKQSYLLASETFLETMESIGDQMEEAEKQKALFFAKQFIDTMSPSNFVMTNPEILAETMNSGGANLVRGMENLLRDFDASQGRLKISQTDKNAFKVGENLATSKGSVVYRNELIELIQYAPTTDKVYAQPLLILPPFINKFYILDMRPENSLIKWIVGQGFTTFVVSWRNPTEAHKYYGFEEYMREGLFAALEKIEELTGQKQTSVVGYCIGGTLVSMALSYLKSQGKNPIGNVTYFASQTDFSKAGELLTFVDKEQIQNIHKMMQTAGGYLEGYQMADTFNLLRANDLIWSFVVNNYLLGRDPFPFDLLYWNSDTTRMPMRLQLEYMESCYLKNELSQKKMTIADHLIDLSQIDIPMYIQASKEDHIAPADSVYRGAKLYSGDVRFTLAGSGHIAGVINHPDNNKYQHWLNYSLEEDNFEEWFKNAQEHQGSWWNDWSKWLSEHSGKQVKSREIKDEICAAPGTYVLE